MHYISVMLATKSTMSQFISLLLIVLLSSLTVYCQQVKLVHIQSIGYDSKKSKDAITKAVNDSNLSISHYQDGRCNSSAVLNWLVNEIGNNTAVVLDGSCPNVSSSVIQARFIDTIVMSYTPYTWRREKREASHFLLYPVVSETGGYLISLMKAFNWNILVIVTEKGFLREVRLITNELRKNQLYVNIQLNKLENCGNTTADACPILFMLGKNKLLRTLCNAETSGKGYPNYLYIIPYWYDVNWWRDAPCDTHIIVSALNRSLSIFLNPPGQQLLEPLSDAVLSLYATDAISTVIKSVNESNYNNISLLRSIENIDMLGRTGLITFTNRTRPLSSINVHQYKTVDGDVVRLVTVGNISDDFVLSFENASTILPVYNIIKGIHIFVPIVFYTLAVLGLLVTGACFIFNCMYRKKRVIKLSSPQLNYVILIGAVLFYVTIFFEASPRLSTTNPVIITILSCNGSSLGAIACALCMGTIHGKVFRIFYIFYNPSPNKKRIRDWHILVYVFILTGISSVAVILQWTTPLFRRIAILLPTKEVSSTTNDLGIVLNPVVYICGETNLIAGTVRAFLISGSIYIMQILSLFLTCFTRKVNIKALNDTLSIKAIIFITTVCLTALLLFLSTLTFYPTILMSLSSLVYFIVPTTILLLTFVPKMVSLYKDPEGKNVFTYYHSQESVTMRLRKNTTTNLNFSPLHIDTLGNNKSTHNLTPRSN